MLTKNESEINISQYNKLGIIKGTLTDIYKTVFWKVLFMWSSMPIFNFIEYTLTELFRKPDNWRQIYKQTSSTFYCIYQMICQEEKIIITS